MIYHFLPYTTGHNFSECLNDYCSMVPSPDDWVVIWDYDTLRSDPDFGRDIEKAIKLNRDFDLLSIMATRTGTRSQRLNKEVSEERDLIKLHDKCLSAKKKGLKAIITDRPVAGYMMAFRKKLWMEYPFFNNETYNEILGIDYIWCVKLLHNNKRIGVIPGIAVIHFYRFNKHRQDKSHLFKKENI